MSTTSARTDIVPSPPARPAAGPAHEPPPTADVPVAIIGAGPAGLLLGHLLHAQGIGSVILEHRSREHVERRVRAGMLEQPTVDLLREAGLAGRLDREAIRHRGFFIRLDGRTHHLDFAELTGKRATVYGQTEVVKDLIAARLGSGEPLVFGAQDVRLHDIEGPAPTVTYERAGRRHTVTCRIVAGCDGAHGVSRRTLLERSAAAGRPARLLRREYPFAWLGILARTTPDPAEPVYCAHPRGLCLLSMRGPRLTRLYLQIPAGDGLGDWPDERIWDELRLRSASEDHPPLETGEIVERSIAPLRSEVIDRMSHGRLHLAGDAAHIVPPTGAKGLNLAVGDVSVLARAIAGSLTAGDDAALAAYGETALPRVWRAQLYSWSMTTMLHRFGDDPYEWELRRAQVRALISSRDEQRAHAHVHMGLPFATHWRW